MEDRLTSALWLEGSDLDPEVYGRSRAPAVLPEPGVMRASWWRNVRPGRQDLPRRLPEIATLGVYEVVEGFDPPAPPAGGSGMHFRRTPRPGQGRLTGRPTLGLSLVLISPREPSSATALRDWADFVHLRHITEAAVPGYTMVTPYERVDGQTPRFLHLYEMDTDDPEASFSTMTPLVEQRLGPPGTPGFDEWAWHPALCIEYVNTFRLVGEAWTHSR